MIGLYRTHDGRVHRVQAVRRGKRLAIEAVAAPGVDVSLEAYTAQERSTLLTEVLGLPIAVAAAPG